MMADLRAERHLGRTITLTGSRCLHFVTVSCTFLLVIYPGTEVNQFMRKQHKTKSAKRTNVMLGQRLVLCQTCTSRIAAYNEKRHSFDQILRLLKLRKAATCTTCNCRVCVRDIILFITGLSAFGSPGPLLVRYHSEKS